MKRLKSMIKVLTLPQKEAEEYCRDSRYKRNEKKGAYAEFILFHNMLHHILVYVLKLQRVLKKQKIILVGDERIKTDRPVIFAGTHIGGDDVETAFEVLKTPCWLLLGDPKEIYRNSAGLMLDLNGVICFDTAHKRDRQIAKERCIALLKKGGNLLIFPEGAWNISPNQLVMHLFPGVAEMARECGAEIVPFAIGRNGKTYYVNIGGAIRVEQDDPANKYGITAALRDTLASLKWEIIEKSPPQKRNEIPANYSQKYLDEVMGTQVATYSVQDVLDTKYRPKNQVDHKEVFEVLNGLQPTCGNAFLFNKRLS